MKSHIDFIWFVVGVCTCIAHVCNCERHCLLRLGCLRGSSFTVLLVHSSVMSRLLFNYYLNLLFPTTTTAVDIKLLIMVMMKMTQSLMTDIDHWCCFMTRLLLVIIIIITMPIIFLPSGPTDSLSSWSGGLVEKHCRAFELSSDVDCWVGCHLRSSRKWQGKSGVWLFSSYCI